MKNKQLSNQELRELNDQIKVRFNLTDFFTKKDRVELAEDKIKLIMKNSEPTFFYKDDKLFPTLRLLLKNNIINSVAINMPAVPFIVGGADIMRPGITTIDDFQKDAVISIVDEKNKKPIAVGIAFFSSDEIKAMKKGKVIKNIHYVGDSIWKAETNK